MGGRAQRVVAIGAAVAAMAVAGGTALAHESSTVGNTFLGDFARRLGVSPAKVRDAYRAALVDRIEAAVRAGRLTRAEADAIETRVRSGEGFLPFGGPDGPGRRPLGSHGPFEHRGPSPFHAAAAYLGVTEEAIHEWLASGRTLAQLAAAKGKSVPGLEAAMTAPLRARLGAAVESGRLTRDQAARFTHAVTARLDAFVRHGFSHHFTPPHSGSH